MTETATAATPNRRWSWWSILLIASLAVNLLFGGAAVSRYYFRQPTERIAAAGFLQLVPPKFFADLKRPRRAELMALLRANRERFRAGQQVSRQAAEDLADALEAAPYDEARLRTVTEAFSQNGADLIAIGTQAARELIAKLSPEERASLALRIRERAKTSRRK